MGMRCRDEAVNACCATAEARLPAAAPTGSHIDVQSYSLAAKPVIGHFNFSSRPAQSAHPAVQPLASRPAEHLHARQQPQQAQLQQVCINHQPADDQPHGQHAQQQVHCQQPANAHTHNPPTATHCQSQHAFPQHSRLDLPQQQEHTRQAQAPAPTIHPGNAGHHRHCCSSIASGINATDCKANSSLKPQDIQHRARRFAQQMHMLPPLAPRHNR